MSTRDQTPLDLTKPIRAKDSPSVACKYMGTPFELRIIAFADGGVLTYADDAMNVLFENVPEVPWYPPDGRVWHEIQRHEFPACKSNARIVVLTESEREDREHEEDAKEAGWLYWDRTEFDDVIVAWAYADQADDPSNQSGEVAK